MNAVELNKVDTPVKIANSSSDTVQTVFSTLPGLRQTYHKTKYMWNIECFMGTFYSLYISWTSEILKMFHYPHKIQRLYKKKCDRLLLQSPGEISNLLVKHFTLKLRCGWKINSNPVQFQFVTLPWNVK